MAQAGLVLISNSVLHVAIAIVRMDAALAELPRPSVALPAPRVIHRGTLPESRLA